MVVMNQCETGHKEHDTKIVNSVLGDIVVYDWEKYANTENYCTGDDAVSQTIEKTKSWDEKVNDTVIQILDRRNDRSGLFIDGGCHIGWFSMLAQQLGYPLIGYDGDAENLKLFEQNVKLSTRARKKLIWFDEKLKPRKWCESCTRFKHIELYKVDIEGNEQYAIEYYKQAFEQRAVRNVIMEISPVFNSSYPALIDRMVSYGFEVLELAGTPFNFDFNFQQKDLWFRLPH